MTLAKYRQARLVIQRPDATAYAAARAMESHHIGVVLVQHRGKLVGLVTDRDLALRVIAAGLAPDAVPLVRVMSRDPATLPVDGYESEALELMRTRRIRRIPLLEGEHVVGMVSIDDLILSDGADPEAVAAVIQAQLAEAPAPNVTGRRRESAPAPARPGGRSAGEARRMARLVQSSHRAARLVQELTGLEDDERAMIALEVVVSGLVRRLTVPEAGDLLSQLPRELRTRLADLRFGPERSLTRETIEVELAQRLDLSQARAAELVGEVGGALSRLVSAGELAHVRAQLPKDMQSILPDGVVHLVP